MMTKLMATAFVLLPVLSAQERTAGAKPAQEKVDMAAMMAKARQFTEPGGGHKILERFLGSWSMETRFVMGGPETKPVTGDLQCRWLMAGRWVECRGQSPFLGRPTDLYTVIGYDNFKQSYRVVTVTSMDTAMNVSEGDMDPGGKALITYGTIDEYLTGEHDKMVRYVWRFDSPDVIRHEVHDLPIGEKNTQVVSMRYTRKTK